HHADDIQAFVSRALAAPSIMLIGNRVMKDEPHVPGSSRFGRAFSNFWVRLETGLKISDTQSGFRYYPAEALRLAAKLLCNAYDFEIEVLVKSAWRGISIESIPIKVTYARNRVTH